MAKFNKITYVPNRTKITADNLNDIQDELIRVGTLVDQNNGVAGPQGPQGPQGEKGDTGEQGPAGLDGKSVELQKSPTHIQWRQEGDSSWTNLVALTDITGPQGPAGTSSGGSSITRYVPTGGTGFAYVTADGPGVSISKKGSLATLTVPPGVQVFGVQVRFLAQEIGAEGKCQIKHGMGTSYDDFVLPHVQVVNDINGNRAMKITVGANFNVTHDQIEVTGMQTNTDSWVSLRLI